VTSGSGDGGRPAIDSSVAHSARRYNYWLGGKDHFAADRASGDEIERQFPGMRAGVRANREVLGRMVGFLAAEAGVRQFLDIGVGLPFPGSTHEIAQRTAPESRVVYVDNDRMVMTHAHAALESSPLGRAACVEADLREPGGLLADPHLRATLDLDRPVALVLTAVLQFIPGDLRPIVGELVAGLPSGSYLAVTHFTVDFMPEVERERYAKMLADGRTDTLPRGHDEVAALFDGLDMVSPGLVLATEWRPAPGAEKLEPRLVSMWAGAGRKP
jgi:hypothetical protein